MSKVTDKIEKVNIAEGCLISENFRMTLLKKDHLFIDDLSGLLQESFEFKVEETDSPLNLLKRLEERRIQVDRNLEELDSSVDIFDLSFEEDIEYMNQRQSIWDEKGFLDRLEAAFRFLSIF